MNTPNSLPAPEDIQRIPDRPFGQLSAMVAEHLPRMIDGRESFPSPRELILMAEDQLHRVTDTTGLMNPVKNPHLGLLDALMVERAMLNNDMAVPGAVGRLVEETAARLKHMPGISYELCIGRNPIITDPRTFTDGEIGRGELEFYRRHLIIEREIAKACVMIHAYIASNVHEALDGANGGVTAFDNGLTELKRNLAPDQFDGFRAYFTNGNRQLPGPSGLFSGGIYTLDAYLAGDHPDMQAFQLTKDAQESFYPTLSAEAGFTGISDMRKAREHTLYHGGLLSVPTIDRGVRADIATRMANARRNHISVVQQFLPDVMKGKGGGTGSVAAVAAFLHRPVAAYDAIAENLSPAAS